MDVRRLMDIGALTLVSEGMAYTDAHASAGFSREEWELLTETKMWTPSQRRRVRSILSEAVSVSLTAGGLPVEPLPAQYVAGVICRLVAPVNRLVAAIEAPETFKAIPEDVMEGAEIAPTTRQEMMRLVIMYSSGTLKTLAGRDVVREDEVLKEVT